MLPGGAFVKETLKQEQRADAKKVHTKLDQARKELLESLGDEYSMGASEGDLRSALGGRVPSAGGTVSVKRKGPAADPAEAAAAEGPGEGRKGKRRRG